MSADASAACTASGAFAAEAASTAATARSHSFRELAEAIDTAFARWDRAHL